MMVREEAFRISKLPYAVDLTSLRVETSEPHPDFRIGGRSHSVCVNAVWFRRRRQVTVSCIGVLHHLITDRGEAPQTVEEALARFGDGRYGGDCTGRWDGKGYWGSEKPERVEEHLALLRPMLENYPAIPPSYDGWWRYA